MGIVRGSRRVEPPEGLHKLGVFTRLFVKLIARVTRENINVRRCAAPDVVKSKTFAGKLVIYQNVLILIVSRNPPCAAA